jgi:hypothetical protein
MTLRRNLFLVAEEGRMERRNKERERERFDSVRH